jgi:hypothetical protein
MLGKLVVACKTNSWFHNMGKNNCGKKKLNKTNEEKKNDDMVCYSLLY